MKKTLICLVTLMCCSAASALACITEESEPNDTEVNANGPVCSDTPVSGSIRNRHDVDWFYLNLEEESDIQVNLSHASNADLDWFLYGDTGGVLASGETSNNPETGSLEDAAPGTYFIRVEPWSGRGDYELTVTFAEADNGGGGNGGGSGSACDYGDRPNAPSGLTQWLTGSPTPTCVDLNDPAALLMGGGADVDDAFSQRVAPHIQGGDVVVLRTSGTDGYNDYLMNLTQANSVETLVVDTRSLADSDYVDWAIRSAEFVFIAGGDQSDYLNQWLNTRLQDAVQSVWDKGGIVGGTSAGNAVLGEFIYDPDGVPGAVSDEVVEDFCHNTINISEDFLITDPLYNVITDTHFYERDRMGRLMVFQAHLFTSTRGIGVSEETSLFVSASGEAVVDGRYEVYILRGDGQTDYVQTACGEPVIIEDLLRYRLLSGDIYNLDNDTSSVSPIRIGVDGRFSDYYTPADPY
ncbi:MAG: Type 1 glutamine amidotransferase-like domain-containing protein [Natronospirillum sp.]|uniref:pre-peptidase C-terminal domain-containing protein n=1 Tax=Natronospirillum sp. TaxID=2812955 RepID=UPI0025CFBC21|nr:pre-peptidase C-terminal domain-containing protein [Natronospirillum sp.]MCH8551139.1 Type 1 glutamine amidotransferase-like domain-containing protein [Natronospirillum sp.]